MKGLNKSGQILWDEVEQYILENWERSRVDEHSPLKPGSIKLPYPYLSIGEGHNLLFYWDTYFTNIGLLLTDKLKHYAVNAAENLFFLVDKLGYIPNSTEKWGLNRSQIPFLTLIVKEIYETIKAGDHEWLKKAYLKLKKEYAFWTNLNNNLIENHSTPVKGLQRYSHHASQKEMLAFFEEIAPRFDFGSLFEVEKLRIANDWLAEAEAGLDFTPRFEHRCTNFIPICLNSNLYIYEENFQWMIEELGISEKVDWKNLADQRADLINSFLWNDQKGIYLDYDYINQRPSKIASAVTFLPMLAGIASEAQAKKIVDNLSIFEYDYGVTICQKSEQRRQYQWDYPAGWPPVQAYVVKALDRYGYQKEAVRIAKKYLDLVAKNYVSPVPIEAYDPESKKNIHRTKGKIYEKYNVVTGEIFDAEYPANEFLGWSAGVFIYLKKYVERIGK